MRDRIRRAIARHIRHASTALIHAIERPRYVCGVCHERTHYPDAHHFIEHGDLT